MLLNKHNLNIVNFVSDDENKSEALQYLHVTPDYTEACDGHTLVRITVDKNLKDEDFPEIPPFKSGGKQKPEVLLRPEAVKQALNNLPERSCLPITTNVLLDAPESNDRAILYTIDLDTTQANSSKDPPYTYPKTEGVIPKYKPVLHVRFNADKLIAILELLKLCRNYDSYGRVDLLFHDSHDGEKQLVVKAKTELGQDFFALIMPMTMEDVEREDKE